MQAQVQEVRGDLTLVIPREVADSAAIKDQTQVDIAVENGVIVVRPTAQPKYVLQDLLAQVTDENRHPETDWGPPVPPTVFIS
jgi:antitoxin ChpS